MSIANYSDLKQSVTNWLNRSDLSTYIPDFITLGEKRIFREVRIRAMEESLSTAISSGVVVLPSDYVQLKHAYINGSPVQSLQRKSAEWIYSKYPTRSSQSKPLYIAREAGNFIFGPYPDSAYTVKGVYYKRLTALSDSNTTNWFTTNAPDLLLFSALLEAEPFIQNDERLVLWEAKYQSAKRGIQDEEGIESNSGSPISMSVS